MTMGSASAELSLCEARSSEAILSIEAWSSLSAKGIVERSTPRLSCAKVSSPSYATWVVPELDGVLGDDKKSFMKSERTESRRSTSGDSRCTEFPSSSRRRLEGAVRSLVTEGLNGLAVVPEFVGLADELPDGRENRLDEVDGNEAGLAGRQLFDDMVGTLEVAAFEPDAYDK